MVSDCRSGLLRAVVNCVAGTAGCFRRRSSGDDESFELPSSISDFSCGISDIDAGRDAGPFVFFDLPMSRPCLTTAGKSSSRGAPVKKAPRYYDHGPVDAVE